MSEQAIEANDFESKADEFLNKEATETPTDSSSDQKPEDSQPQDQDPGAEPEKTEQVKVVEEDESLSIEQKIEKVKEILGDDEKALDAYIKDKGYHNDPAWIKQRELIDRLKKEGEAKVALSEEDKADWEKFKTFRSSPEYIKTSMKAQGYTQEAIDKKLQESGFEVSTKSEDDVTLVIDKLGINLSSKTPEEAANIKANVDEFVKVADIVFNDRISKILPKELEPLREHIGNTELATNASKLSDSMETQVKKDGVLDFAKDIEPELNKFLDENPDALQPDVYAYFKEINHNLTVERLKTGKKKEERDGNRGQLRQNLSITGSPSGVPQRTGDFEKDADAFLETV